MAKMPTLNDAKVKALPPAPPGKRREYPDTGDGKQERGVPGLVVRVTDKRSKSFVLIARYPGKQSKGAKTAGQSYPERRALGTYPEMSLAEARAKARRWRALIAKDIDPAVEEARQRAAEAEADAARADAEAAKRTNSFAAAVEDYVARKVHHKTKPMRPKTAKFVTDTLRREFVRDFPIFALDEKGKPVVKLGEDGKPILERSAVYLNRNGQPTLRVSEDGKPILGSDPRPVYVVARVRKGLGDMPLADVRWSHIKERIADAEQRGTTGTPHHLLAIMSGFLNWCVRQEKIDFNVCAGHEVEAPKARRTRTLNDDELRALWSASGQLGTYGAMVKFLLLTLQRRENVATLQRSEIGPAPTPTEDGPPDSNARRRMWTIPASKFKMQEPVAVYLSDRALAVLDSLDKGTAGDFVFSKQNGKHPIKVSDHDKKRLDALMLAALKEAAIARGEDPEKSS